MRKLLRERHAANALRAEKPLVASERHGIYAHDLHVYGKHARGLR